MPKPGPRTTYKYSDEFKASAVRLSQLSGVSVQDVAESLYIHPFMLAHWQKQAREGSRKLRREQVKSGVLDLYGKFRARYGAPRLTRKPNATGIKCSANYVAGIMRAQGIKARSGK